MSQAGTIWRPSRRHREEGGSYTSSYVEGGWYHSSPQNEIWLIPWYHFAGGLLAYHVPPFFSSLIPWYQFDGGETKQS